MPPEVGLVIPYWFLWGRESEAGEESGRKARPCVVVIAVRRGADEIAVAVAPITHAPPAAGQRAVELDAAVKRQLKLDHARSWVICDELNEFTWPGFDLGRTPDGRSAFGRLPFKLTDRIRAEAADAIRAGAMKKTKRD
ncbi:MAG TPA: growth inhibitor PemK [Terricaulis sp.]|nr:growth inhibitor PemK [Terricaulis sp.]HRP10158.1 growth inhibitor PemK [Terricaulis sp.]